MMMRRDSLRTEEGDILLFKTRFSVAMLSSLCMPVSITPTHLDYARGDIHNAGTHRTGK